MEDEIVSRRDVTLTVSGTAGVPGVISDLWKLLDCARYSLSIHEEQHLDSGDRGWKQGDIDRLKKLADELQGRLK